MKIRYLFNMQLATKPPKVSVCIITYNQEKYISQCLQSIVDQKTDFNFEVIVGDDCSTDGTRVIVEKFAKEYPKIIKPIYHTENIGGGSYNFLIVHRAAQGEYVAHMDGDDYALPGKLQAQASILDSKLECTAVWHQVDYFDDLGKFCSGKTSDLSCFTNGAVTFKNAIQMGFIGVHSSIMYRRATREVIELNRKVLDIYFTWDLLSKGVGYIISEVYGRYRIAAVGSLTVSSANKINKLLISHADHFVKNFPEQRKNFFIWAVTMAIIDFKNMRSTVFKFLQFAIRNASFASPADIYLNLINIRNTRVRWKSVNKQKNNQ